MSEPDAPAAAVATDTPTSFAARSARLRRIATGLLIALFVGWAIGQTFRDANLLLALLFYIPSPFVFLVLTAAAILERSLGARHRAAILATLAIFPLLMVVFVENHWRTPAVPPRHGPTLRLVHWNCMRGKLGFDKEIQEILDQHPDLIVISEPPSHNDFDAVLAACSKATPGTTWKLFRLRHLMLLAKGKFEIVKTLEGTLQLDAQLLRWHSPQGPVNLLAIDVVSTPWLFRDPILRDVTGYMVKYEPDLVVGDCNSPRRSRAFTELPLGYVHAYDAAGSGWGYTWFTPFPMFAIDQCMVGANARADHYEIQTSFLSDHRRQVLDFHLNTVELPNVSPPQ